MYVPVAGAAMDDASPPGVSVPMAVAARINRAFKNVSVEIVHSPPTNVFLSAASLSRKSKAGVDERVPRPSMDFNLQYGGIASSRRV